MLKPIDLMTARRLIDFSGNDESLRILSENQLEGAVALQNMIVNPDVGMGYLADEVGMGKTYVALGVVAMMRYFNPMLRVLYICPSRNIQEKWEREYQSFIGRNVNVKQGRIKTRDNNPAAPYISCRNVTDLLHAATSGYYADYFIGKDSFSISLSSNDEAGWTRKRDELKALVPALQWEKLISDNREDNKLDVKYQYASALNYILPTFDLVVIDEAHNFKHDFESSHRNRVLSRVLGFSDSDSSIKRVKSALLLSATPYDRNLTQLRNQLKLIGRLDQLPVDLDDKNEDQVREALSCFMVRRLNRLRVNNTDLTRNMYRREWRKGANAEIKLETDEQKLVTALVQKKVGEMLDRQTESPSFQMGLLASFESYVDSAGSGSVEFDGDRNDYQQNTAKDRHVISHISDSYKNKYKLGQALPHPKMDAIVKRLYSLLFEKGRKQLIYVRRVKSVSELKGKLDDAYNVWIKEHINNVLDEHENQRDMLQGIYDSYNALNLKGDVRDIGGELDSLHQDEGLLLPAKSDTFYAWFFRGEVLEEALSQLKTAEGSYPTPDAVRVGLAAKNQALITFFEPNWAMYLCEKNNIDLEQIINEYGEDISKLAREYASGIPSGGHLDIFQACQYGFIEWVMGKYGALFLEPLLPKKDGIPSELIQLDDLSKQLNTSTFYSEIERVGLSSRIIPFQSDLYEKLRFGSELKQIEIIQKFDIHKSLLSFLLRTSHGVIDLYLARLMQGPKNLSQKVRHQWIVDFVCILKKQKKQGGFSTYEELAQVAENIDLIVKNNIPEILKSKKSEYAKIIQRALSPVSPVIGASGETSNRSSQARKFRMPGYPLALVSTDVFQEGEDLHTFCDSVMHFGLSGSPVSLEQKVGRVDRIGSLTQRRLMLLQREARVDEYIQVTFPYVKESIEVLQVRKICQNYNSFIESLHDVQENSVITADSIDKSAELQNKEEIPEQILRELQSPYSPSVDERNNHNAVEIIDKTEAQHQADVDHIEVLVKEKLKKDNFQAEYVSNAKNEYEFPKRRLNVTLKSARSSGQLLLSLMKHSEPDSFELTQHKSLLNKMQQTSWSSFNRTIAIASEKDAGSFDLYSNAEMLVGREFTGRLEINSLFDRIDDQHEPEKYSDELHANVATCLDSINNNTKISVDRSQKTKLHVERENGVTSLVFRFGDTGVSRSQKVNLYQCENRCVFISYATVPGYAQKLSVSDIMKHTWLRNRHIDLVEFVVARDFALAGRVVCPIENIGLNEFIYCAYTLAVEADDLEYLLSRIDSH